MLITCAEEVFHEHLSYVNMLGLLLCLLGAHLYAFVNRRSGAAARQEPRAHQHTTPSKQRRASGEWLWGGVRKPYTAKPL